MGVLLLVNKIIVVFIEWIGSDGEAEVRVNFSDIWVCSCEKKCELVVSVRIHSMEKIVNPWLCGFASEGNQRIPPLKMLFFFVIVCISFFGVLILIDFQYGPLNFCHVVCNTWWYFAATDFTELSCTYKCYIGRSHYGSFCTICEWIDLCKPTFTTWLFSAFSICFNIFHGILWIFWSIATK